MGNPKYAQRNFITLFIFTFASTHMNRYKSFPNYVEPWCSQGMLPAELQHLVQCRTRADCSSSHSSQEWCVAGFQPGNCLCRQDLDLSTCFHIAAVPVGRGFTLFLKKEQLGRKKRCFFTSAKIRLYQVVVLFCTQS